MGDDFADSQDRETFSNGDPVPLTQKGEPCSLCIEKDEPCSRYGHDGSEPAVGRPTKLSDVEADILEAARDGVSQAGCARAGGIDHKTLLNWLHKGEDGHPEYIQFFRNYKRARSEGERPLVKQVARDSPKFLLATSFGYVKTERKELTSPGDDDALRIKLERTLEDVENEPGLGSALLDRLSGEDAEGD